MNKSSQENLSGIKFLESHKNLFYIEVLFCSIDLDKLKRPEEIKEWKW